MSREDDLQAIAEREGWTLQIEDPYGITDLPFRFFENGAARGVSDVLTGVRNGIEFVGFDFDYSMIAGGSLQVPGEFQSSCAIAALAAQCPELMISHETLGHWLEHPIHHEVFEHESPEFARRFRVTTTDRTFAAALFDERVARWFLQQEPDHDLCFEFSERWLMCFTRRRPPEEVYLLIDAVTELRQLIPDPVYERWGAKDGAAAPTHVWAAPPRPGRER